MVQGDVWASFSGATLWQVVALRSGSIFFQRDTWASDTKILARDEANMHGRGLATSANMTQTVCDTIFLHSCAMQVRASSANKQQQASSSKHLIAAQRWNPSSDAPPVPPSAAAVDVARGEHGEAFIGSLLALNRKGFYAALCRVAAQMRSTDPLPDALANLLRYMTLPSLFCEVVSSWSRDAA
jgi:hypothetical protein